MNHRSSWVHKVMAYNCLLSAKVVDRRQKFEFNSKFDQILLCVCNNSSNNGVCNNSSNNGVCVCVHACVCVNYHKIRNKSCEMFAVAMQLVWEAYTTPVFYFHSNPLCELYYNYSEEHILQM